MDTTYVEVDRNDVALIGQHCQFEYCHQLDFLPFRCQSCSHTFCLDHRSESAHECPDAGAWARRQRDAALAKESLGGGVPVRDRIAESPCASPDCKTVIGTARNVGVRCHQCRREYCLKHRFPQDHDCANLEPLGIAATLDANRAQLATQTKTALDRLRAWGLKNIALAKEKAATVAPLTTTTTTNKKPAKLSASARIAAVNALKKKAKGDAKLAPEKRVYVYIQAEAASTTAEVPEAEAFYSRDWVVGRVLDEAARQLQIANENNRQDDEDYRLRVYHVDGGRLLDFGEKLGQSVATGHTLVLLRGVGPPPDLIDLT